MREIVPPAELRQPVCYAVRVHWLSVILSKQKALFSVIFTQPQPLRVLPCPVLPKELHRFRWQRNPTIRSRGFWRRPDSRTEHLQRPQRPEEGHAAACQHRAQRTSWTAGRCSWRWPCSAGNRQRRYGVHYLGGDRPCAEILRRQCGRFQSQKGNVRLYRYARINKGPNAQPSGGGAELRWQCACVQRYSAARTWRGHPPEQRISCCTGRPEERNERRSAAFDHQAGRHGGAGTGQPRAHQCEPRCGW